MHFVSSGGWRAALAAGFGCTRASATLLNSSTERWCSRPHEAADQRDRKASAHPGRPLHRVLLGGKVRNELRKLLLSQFCTRLIGRKGTAGATSSMGLVMLLGHRLQ